MNALDELVVNYIELVIGNLVFDYFD